MEKIMRKDIRKNEFRLAVLEIARYAEVNGIRGIKLNTYIKEYFCHARKRMMCNGGYNGIKYKEISKYFNGISHLSVNTSNANVYIGQLDIDTISFTINKGVAVLNELYGKNITLSLIKGKTQYANTVVSNKLHKIENLVIERQKGELETDLVISENEIIYKDVNNE